MEKKPYPSETQERFIVRLPDGMRERIAEEARANRRSMNAEIVDRLQKSFNEWPAGDRNKLEYQFDVFMSFFAGLLEASMKVVERLPKKELDELGPATLVVLINGLFKGMYDGKQTLELIDGLGPILAMKRESQLTDEQQIQEIDALRARLGKMGDASRRVDRLEAAGREYSEKAPPDASTARPVKPATKRAKKPD